MTQKQIRLVFRALGYLVMSQPPHALGELTPLLDDLRHEINKCGKPECGNGGDHPAHERAFTEPASLEDARHFGAGDCLVCGRSNCTRREGDHVTRFPGACHGTH